MDNGGKLAEGLREFVEQKIKTEREEFEDKLRELVDEISRIRNKSFRLG